MSTTHFGFETVDESEKARRVRGVFDSVASRYDVMKTLSARPSDIQHDWVVVDADGMLDAVRVELYGTQMGLNQAATISAPEPRVLIVTPFDKSQLKVIEKAIREADLGLEPSAQGGLIRVPLPAMNEQRRKELVKVVHKYAEEGKIAVRHARTHGREALKKLNGVSEDDVKHGEKDLQKLHDDYIHKIDDMRRTDVDGYRKIVQELGLRY